MGMEITKSFVVKAPSAAVWDFLTDPAKVARCLPGAAITEKLDDQSYAGTITVKVGPVTANYRGKMRFDRLDAATGEADIVASGQETKGKGGADMRMKSRVVARSPQETEVTVVSDVNVMGVLAQFGRGMIQDVSDQLFQKFTDGMRRELETPAAAPPAPVAAPAAPAVEPAAGTAASPPVAPAPAAAPAPVPAAPAPAAGEPALPPLDVGALGAAAAGRAAARTLRRPGFWIAVIVLALLLCWWIYR
jgi:carbon monoxide dehydrogenase subunit G